VPVTVKLPLEVGVRLQVPVPPDKVTVQVLPVPLRPSDTLTVPLGVPVDCGLTVAVTVALCPTVIEFGETEIPVVLLACFTACKSTFEVLPIKLESPP
jgi:hypothetical protein